MVSPKGVLTPWVRGGTKEAAAICAKVEEQSRMVWFTEKQKTLI